MSTQPEQRKPFRIPAGKYWNEFHRKWMPDSKQPSEASDADVIDHLTQEIRTLEEAIEELIASECRKTCIDCHGDCNGSPLGRSYYKILGDIRSESAKAEFTKPSPECNQHPDAPHGFDRQASHNAGRYVCDCESWQPTSEG